MRAAILASCAAFIAVTAMPVFAQWAGKPVYPQRGIIMMPLEVPSFPSLREFYSHVAKDRGLADPEGDFAIQQIEARASVDHLRAPSGDPVIVVKVEAPRAGDNASFFVLREKPDHLCLLGEMNGRSYESTTANGHLELVLDAGRGAQAPRYQVDGDFLIDLAALARLDRDDPVELDVKHAF